MPPRPEGTDGSDWSYREVIEDRYKRMAVNMAATFLLHQVQSAVVVLKLLWHMIPVWAEERRPDNFVWVLLGLLLLGNVTFYAGRPRGRCVLPLMKVAALCVMATLALHVLGLWRYHLLDPPTGHYSRRLYKTLLDAGSIASPTWLTTFTTAEAVLDAALAATSGICFFTFNNWVRDAMNAAKEMQQRQKAAPVRPPPGAAPAASPKKRR